MTKGADKKSAPLLCKKGVFDFQYNNINGFIYIHSQQTFLKKKKQEQNSCTRNNKVLTYR